MERHAQHDGGQREAVAVFDTPDALEASVQDLLRTGFSRSQLSLLARVSAVERKLGHRFRKVAELADNPAVPRTAFVSTEEIGTVEGLAIGGLMYVGASAATEAVVASAGTLAAALSAAALAGGTCAVAGSVLAGWIGDHHARRLAQQLDRGGLLLWVRTSDPERERRAVEILTRHAGRDVHIHELPGP